MAGLKVGAEGTVNVLEVPVWATYYLRRQPGSAVVEVWRRVRYADGEAVVEYIGDGSLGDQPVKS